VLYFDSLMVTNTSAAGNWLS